MEEKKKLNKGEMLEMFEFLKENPDVGKSAVLLAAKASDITKKYNVPQEEMEDLLTIAVLMSDSIANLKLKRAMKKMEDLGI